MITVEQAQENGWGARAEAFVEWRKEVNRAVIRQCGMSSWDLPDFDYAAAFEDGEDPEEVAIAVLENAGWVE